MSNLMEQIEKKRRELESLVVCNNYDFSNEEVIKQSTYLDDLLNQFNKSNIFVDSYRHLKKSVLYLVTDSMGLKHLLYFISFYPCDDYHGENVILFRTKDDRNVEWNFQEFSGAVEIITRLVTLQCK